MPQVPRAPTTKVERVEEEEPIDMDEPTVEQEEEEKETITMGISHYQFLCDELAFLWFKLANQRKEAWEDKFLANQQLER